MGQLRKIIVLSGGSRGDIQPFIAIALALREANYEVLVSTNIDHANFVKSFGLSVDGFLCDAEGQIRTQPVILKSMSEGSSLKFIKAMAEVSKTFCEHHVSGFLKVVESFQPDLIISGSLMDYFEAVAEFYLKIPCMRVRLWCLQPGPKRQIFGLPSLPCGLNQALIETLFLGGMYDGWRTNDDVLFKLRGCRVLKQYTKEMHRADAMGRGIPCFVCQPEFVASLMSGGEAPSASRKFIGTCVIEEQRQVKNLEQSGDSNFGQAAALKEIEDFIARGSTPVYMGWGSMICKSPGYMVELVVRSLLQSGFRAIVQGGWANLSMELLQETTQDKELLDFARENVLFVQKAPHEWLFPRCAVIVSHGGAGTMAATLRSATPAIITPVFLDQYDNAYLASALGVGLGMKQLQTLRPEDLADALRKVVGDAQLKRRAEEVAAQFRQTEGQKAFVAEMENYWRTIVESGEIERTRQTQYQRSTICLGKWLLC